MTQYDAIEKAYKNGYKAGVKEFSKRLKEAFISYGVNEDGIFVIENIEKEMDGEK